MFLYYTFHSLFFSILLPYYLLLANWFKSLKVDTQIHTDNIVVSKLHFFLLGQKL